MNQDLHNVTTTDELRDDQLDKVTGGDKSKATKSDATPVESLTLNFTKIMFTPSPL